MNQPDRFTPHPDYPEIRFVGRKTELEVFDALLRSSTNKPWILYLYGPGGIGKTQLLRKFLQQVGEFASDSNDVRAPLADSVIDLHSTEHRREETLLRDLALKLAPDGFLEFFEAMQEVHYTSDYDDFDEPPSRQEHLRQLFLYGYSCIPAERIVLAFDTTEQASESFLHTLGEILRVMHYHKPRTLVLLAGRPEGNEKVLAALPEDACKPLEIKGLSRQDVGDYLTLEGFSSLDPKLIDQLSQRVRGRPILIALVVYWLREGNALEELLAVADRIELERRLVERIAQLRYPEDWIILYMALFDRQFNKDIVRIVIQRSSKLSDEQITDQLNNLSRFAFVKHYPPTGSKINGIWLLHDEMRDMINQQVWPAQDMSGATRHRATLAVIEQYYSVEITRLQAQQKLERNQLRTLQQERLYYWLRLDLQKGFEEYRDLAQQAESDGENTSFIGALNSEIALHESRLNPQQRNILLVNRFIAASNWAESLHDDILLSIEERAWEELDATQQAEVRYRLGQIYTYRDRTNQLIELGSFKNPDNNQPSGDWYLWFQEQLNRNDLAPQQRRSIILDFGRFLTTVGTAYRIQNRMNQAVAHYSRAIELFAAAGGAYAEIANTQNNLGFAYQRMGRINEALAECEAALDIRKRLGKLDQLGYSYNVVGMIRVEQLRPEEAEKNFLQALHCFEAADSERGRGLVLIAYGRLMRQWGEGRQILLLKTLDECREQYEAAREKLNLAVNIFRRLGDWSNLMEALNEKGTSLRQLQEWAESDACYRESLTLAQKLGNRYREADNETDLSILYFRQGDWMRALEHSQQAIELALSISAYYLTAKASQVKASIHFSKGTFDLAFDAAADTVAYILRLDPERFYESAAKRTLEYERVLKWLKGEIIFRLPNQGLVEQAITKLTRRWNEEIVDKSSGKKLVDEFPSFISAMERIRQDYQFLKNTPEVSS